MPYLLNADSKVVCAHLGTASPTVVNPRVKVDGAAVVTVAGPYTISCPQAPPLVPCTTGTWLVGASRVKAGGQPVLLISTPSTTAPSGAAMTVTQTQSKVQGQ